jgi:uncharacterized membrane protein
MSTNEPSLAVWITVPALSFAPTRRGIQTLFPVLNLALPLMRTTLAEPWTAVWAATVVTIAKASPHTTNL